MGMIRNGRTTADPRGLDGAPADESRTLRDGN
jgi:hypothetical protein